MLGRDVQVQIGVGVDRAREELEGGRPGDERACTGLYGAKGERVCKVEEERRKNDGASGGDAEKVHNGNE